MYEATSDTALIAELYDVQPQAITWMKPIWSLDGSAIIDFEYVYCNREGLNYLNLSPGQLQGLRISNSPTLTDEMRKAVLSEITGVYLTGKDFRAEVYHPALNKYASILRTRLRDGVLTVVEDRTRENRMIRQLEEQTHRLEEQKKLLDNILKNSSNGISVSQVFRDNDGRVIDALTILANDAAVNYIGLPRDIYLTKKATEIEPAIMDSPYYQACIRTLETGEPFMMQYFMESTKRWLELTVSRLDPDHLIQVFTDVTPMRSAQLELEKAAVTLRTVFDSAQTGMFTFAPVINESGAIVDFRFVMVNTTVSAYAGKTPEQLEGKPGTEWFPGYLDNGEFELYKTCFETGEPQRREIHYTMNGQDYYLDLQCLRIDSQLLITLTDHSTLRQSQLRLEQTVRALEYSNTQLEDFAHAASHDMKEPLRKIRTFTSRLKETLSPRMSDQEMHLFERIEVAAERMQLLVDDLLEFSHVSEQPGHRETVDLNEKLERVLADLELQMEEKGARVESGPLPIIHGNRRQLQQLFQNLIGNALKYSRPDKAPLISVHSRLVKGSDVPLQVPAAYHDQSYHLIEVKDNGIGFEQQYAEQIFKMFQRLHGRSEYSGTGVGLSIAKKVVENHNGYIWAEGQVNEGANFSILLPVEENNMAE